MPSIGRALAACLSIGWGLYGLCPAQTPGHVAISQGADGEYILDLSAAAPSGGSDAFVFLFPGLWAETVLGPDYTGSFCCSDGCDHGWIQSGDTIRGIEIRLPNVTTDSGHMAQVVGWPIIDNIDFKVEPDRVGPDPSTLHVTSIDQGLLIDCPLQPGGTAWIEVRDLQGGLQARARHLPGQPPLRVEGLVPGVYLVQCYSGTTLTRKKVCLLR